MFSNNLFAAEEVRHMFETRDEVDIRRTASTPLERSWQSHVCANHSI